MLQRKKWSGYQINSYPLAAPIPEAQLGYQVLTRITVRPNQTAIMLTPPPTKNRSQLKMLDQGLLRRLEIVVRMLMLIRRDLRLQTMMIQMMINTIAHSINL
jgi:hypothetical protein